MESKTPQGLRTRTSEFALRIVKLYSSLPKTTGAQVPGKQMLHSGTSVGANYREGYRAKSAPDILIKETDELIAIFTTIVTKTKKRTGRI